MDKVIHLDAERERRRLEREFNPDPVRDFFEHAAAYVCVGCAFGLLFWVIWTAQPR